MQSLKELFVASGGTAEEYDKTIVQDEEQAIILVSQSPERWLPLIIDQTPAIVMAAIVADAGCFCHIRTEAQDADSALAAVEGNGLNIDHVRSDLRTPAIVTAALLQNPAALQFLEDGELDDDEVNAALDTKGTAIRHLKGGARTTGRILKAVMSDAKAYNHLTDAERTDDVIMKTLESDGDMIVKIEHKTEERFRIAIANRGAAIRFLSARQRAELAGISLTAVEQDGAAIRYLEELERTQEISLAAVTQKGLALRYVLEQSDGIVEAALKQDLAALRFVDTKLFN